MRCRASHVAIQQRCRYAEPGYRFEVLRTTVRP
jgi:hypothetical protein